MTDQTKEDLVSEADWRAEVLADKLVEYLRCQPQRATSQDVLTAMREWLKSQLALLGVKTSE